MEEEKNYWLCITNGENWAITKERQIWGVSERHKNIVGKVKEGDYLVFYNIMEKKDGEVIQPQLRGVYKLKINVRYVIFFSLIAWGSISARNMVKRSFDRRY